MYKRLLGSVVHEESKRGYREKEEYLLIGANALVPATQGHEIRSWSTHHLLDEDHIKHSDG